MDLGLHDRVYVVTDAAHGLGRACAQQLRAEGARLVLCGPDEDRLRETASALGGSEHALPVAGDLAAAGWETCLVAAAIARYGRLDGALITVSTTPPDVIPGTDPLGTATDPAVGTVLATGDGSWRYALEEHFLGPLRLCRTVAGQISSEGGSIVLILTGPDDPDDGSAPTTSALRPALAATARSLARELGPRSIRVNALWPGGSDREHRITDDTAARESEDLRRAAVARIPLRRFGEPLEFARPAVFLLSPAASYVTGSVLGVDGGLGA